MFRQEILRQLDQLTTDQQRQVLEFIRALVSPFKDGQADSLVEADAEEVLETAEETQRIEIDEW